MNPHPKRPAAPAHRGTPVVRSGVAAALLLILALAACSAAPGTAGTAPAAAEPAVHAAPDIDFARNMIPHHRQAVVLAAMVPARTTNPELRVMATHIGASQQAEIRTLDALLAEWGEPTADPSAPPGSGPRPMMMMGMVDPATLDRLRTLTDGAFDTLWVTSMIGHHRGAIMMAQDEMAHGKSPDAIHVANLIVAAQQQEIAQMTHLISAAQ